MSAIKKGSRTTGRSQHPVVAATEATKTIYLIRHGQSQGQIAKKKGLDRKRDLSLVDCGLTSSGVQQAHDIALLLQQMNGGALPRIDLVISSPLTRALQTAILGFQDYCLPSPPFLIHYGLREVGSSLPENMPRGTIDAVMGYIRERHELSDGLRIDSSSLRPSNWPREEVSSQRMSKADRIPQIIRWIATERPEQHIAVVCHYNVIRSFLGSEARPTNAVPIRCQLHSDGTIQPC
jgi:broad specificity phosphatase PhoE